MTKREKIASPAEEEVAEDATTAFGAVIKRLRQEKALSLDALAKAAGISIGALSQLERGIGNPSLRTMTSLRRALNVDVSDLFDETPRQNGGHNEDASFVRRASQRPRLDVGYISKELLSSGTAHNLQFMILHVPPHGSSGARPLSYPAEKGGMILSGELILRVGLEEALLAEGDSFMFDSSVPHSFRNPTDVVTKVMWIIGAVPMEARL